MSGPKNTKRDGTLYEQRFVVRALEHGLEPHPTTGEYLQHDFLLGNAAGTVYKVQIKGTSRPEYSRGAKESRSTPRYRIIAGRGHNKESLDCSKVDVLAAYVAPNDAWYLIPCLKLRSKGVWVYPDVENSRAYYEQFREKWDMFLT